jgi:hypothetical protein
MVSLQLSGAVEAFLSSCPPPCCYLVLLASLVGRVVVELEAVSVVVVEARYVIGDIGST